MNNCCSHMHAVSWLNSFIITHSGIARYGNRYLLYIYLNHIANPLLFKIHLSTIIEEIVLVHIPLQRWRIGIYIAIFWYQKYIHQVTLITIIFRCHLFGIISKKKDLECFGIWRCHFLCHRKFWQ